MPECIICANYYSVRRRPVIGSCGHTVCQFCRLRLVGLDCPHCRTSRSFSQEVINYALLEVVEQDPTSYDDNVDSDTQREYERNRYVQNDDNDNEYMQSDYEDEEDGDPGEDFGEGYSDAGESVLDEDGEEYVGEGYGEDSGEDFGEDVGEYESEENEDEELNEGGEEMESGEEYEGEEYEGEEYEEQMSVQSEDAASDGGSEQMQSDGSSQNSYSSDDGGDVGDSSIRGYRSPHFSPPYSDCDGYPSDTNYNEFDCHEYSENSD